VRSSPVSSRETSRPSCSSIPRIPTSPRAFTLMTIPTTTIKKWEPFLPTMHRLGITRMRLRQQEKCPASFSVVDWDEYLFLRDTVNSFKAMLREGEALASEFPAGAGL